MNRVRMIPVSKKRLITTTLGVILAVAIIFTAYTLGNNMAREQFYNQIKENPYSIERSVSGNFTNILRTYNEIKNISHVNEVFLSITAYGNFENYSSSSFIPVVYLEGADITLINGSLPKNSSEVLVSAYFSQLYNISVGEHISLTYPSVSNGTLFVNYTVVGVANWKPELDEENQNFVNGGQGIMVMKNAMKYLNDSGVNIIGYVGVSIDPAYLLSSQDYNQVANRIKNIGEEVDFIIYKNNLQSTGTGYYFYTSNGTMYLMQAIFYSLPVIVMGVYLSRVGIEIEFTERRREFGILKIRGITGLSLGKFVLIEAAIYSILGGILGYLLGEGLAYFSNVLFLKMPYFILDWSVLNLFAAIIVSVFLFIIAFIKPWNKIKKESIISLISHYSQGFKKVEYTKRNFDLGISILLWAYLFIAIWLIENANFEGGFNIIVILAFIVMGSIGFLFPFILIILPLTMSRLLTLGTTRVYKFIASWVAKLFKTSGELAEMSIERNPKRAAYLAFMLAFILTLSSFLAVAMDSSNDLSDIQNKAVVGGDIKIILDNQKIPWNILNDSKLVASYVVIYSMQSPYNLGASEIFQVNMKRYIETIYNGELFLKEGKLNGQGVVITASEAKYKDLSVGDQYTINFGDEIKTYKIEAIMYSFPGINQGTVIVDMKNPNGTPSFVILKARNMELLKDDLSYAGYNYELPPKENSATGQWGFINSLLLYLVILGASAIFIVQYSSLLNRRGEIALYKVRGARNWQIVAMLMTEGLTVIIISLIIGVAVGITLAYSLFSLVSASAVYPTVFVISWDFLVYTGILIISYIISQYVLSHIFSRTKPSEVIRGLGGEM